MSKNGKRPRIGNMPGVTRWLLDLEYFGPRKRPSGRSGASARAHGLTDFWVMHKGSKRWMFLETLKKKENGNPYWYEIVDYARGHEMITPYGRALLHEHLPTREGQRVLADWKRRRRTQLKAQAAENERDEE